MKLRIIFFLFGMIIFSSLVSSFSINQDHTYAVETDNYRIIRQEGNETLYNISLQKIPITYGDEANFLEMLWNEFIKLFGYESINEEDILRYDTMITLSVKSDSIYYNFTDGIPIEDTFCQNSKNKPQDCENSLVYDIPSTLPYSIDKGEKTGSITKAINGDLRQFSIQLNPLEDKHLKIGENSIEVERIIHSYTDNLLFNTTFQDTNYTHLNVSEEYIEATRLKHYLSFDLDDNRTSVDVTDRSGNGSYVADAKTGVGVYGLGAYFDGADDQIIIDGTLGAKQSHTYATWIYVNNTALKRIYDRNYDAGGTGSYYSAGVFGHVFRVGAGTVSITAPIPTHQWVHVVATYNNQTGRGLLYMNGTLVDNKSVSTVNAESNPIYLGSVNFDFDGRMDEFMFFWDSLTGEEVSAIYTNQSQRFDLVGYSQHPFFNATTTTENRVNVTFNMENQMLFGTLINVSLINGTNGVLSSTEMLMLNESEPLIFNISAGNNNFSLNVSYIPDANRFYTPALQEANITYTFWTQGAGEPESDPPGISSLTESPSDPATYVDGNVYEFNATITDATGVDTVLIQFNGTNYTVYESLVSNVYNFTISNLGVGVYDYIWYANDTGGYGDSQSGSYTINKASGEVNTSVNETFGNITITQHGRIWINGSLVNGLGNIKLYLNGSLINVGTSPLSNLTDFNYTGLHNITATYEGNDNYTAHAITRWVLVNPLDTQAPQYSNQQNRITNGSQFVCNQIHGFNITWTDDTAVDSVIIQWNGTNYTIYESTQTDVYNFTISSLTPQNYDFVFWSNDTTGNSNVTDNYYYTILKATPTGSLSVTPSTTETYPTETTATGTESNGCDAGGTYGLFRNNISKSNPETITLGVGVYHYIYNYSGNENYTVVAVLDEDTLTISKGTPTIKTYINGVAGNVEAINGTNVTFEVNLSLGSFADAYLNLTEDDVQINSSNIENITFIKNYTLIGTYEINGSYTGNANWSAIEEVWSLTIRIGEVATNVSRILPSTPNMVPYIQVGKRLRFP